MRVLIYAEPFPVRDVLSHFNDVVQKFLAVLTAPSAVDFRVFANNSTFDKVGEKLLAPVAARMIRSTQAEESLFESYMQPWESGGSDVWLQLMAGEGAISESTLQVLRRIWSVFPFEAIVHWGENGAITRFLDEYPVTRVAMELGCTRPPFLDSIVMDPFGTNGAGVVPKLSVADLRAIVDNRPMSRHEALFSFSKNISAEAYTEQFKPLPVELSQRLPRERLVFLPLQLFDDANLLRFSPYKSIKAVVLDVVPKLAEKGYTTLIKPHPAARHRKGSEVANSIARSYLRPWDSHVIWTDQISDVSNARLIALADFTVTVNSSVGFEALYFDAPVVVLGDAVYKPKGLFPTLETMLDGRFDRGAYLDGIGILRRFMLGGYLQPEKTRHDASAFASRIAQIAYLYRLHSGDPVAFARDFWYIVGPAQQAFAQSSMLRGNSVPGKAEFGLPVLIAEPVKTEAKAADINAVAPSQVARAYRPIVRRLMAQARADSVESFVAWLTPLWATPEGQAQIIALGKLVDPEYYLAANPDVKAAGMGPVAHFAASGLEEQRSPRASLLGINAAQTFEALNLAAEGLFLQPGLSEFALSPAETESRQSQLDALRGAVAQSSNRIAVVAHLYYTDLVPQILAKLANIPESFDLIVTLPDWGARRTIDLVRAAYPAAVFYHAANRGRDIGPFMDVLPALIGRYDAVLKIQTKQGYYRAGRLVPEFGKIWRDEALAALLGSPERVSAILNALRAETARHLIGPAPYLLSLADYPYHDEGVLADELLSENLPGGMRSETDVFFADAMFWLRPECLHALAEIELPHFAPEDGGNYGALAHLVERMFGHAAGQSGRLAGAPVDPTAALILDPQPTRVKMDDYLTAQQEHLRLLAAKNGRGALIW
jgi:hypothetical protein